MISKCHFQTLPFYDSVIVYVSMGRHRRPGAVAPAMCVVHLQSMNVPGVGWYRPHQRVLQRDGLSTPEVCPWCSQDVEEVASNQHNQEQTGVRKGLWAWEIGRNSNLTLASTTVTSRNLGKLPSFHFSICQMDEIWLLGSASSHTHSTEQSIVTWVFIAACSEHWSSFPFFN